MTQRVLCQTGLTATKVFSKTSICGDHLRQLPHRHDTRSVRSYSSHIAATPAWDHNGHARSASCHITEPKTIGERAKLKQADKEFFVDLLTSAATKRDAKAYISRLKTPIRRKLPVPPKNEARSKVNLGNLFGRSRIVEPKPVFTQHYTEEDGFDEEEVQHIALVKLSGIEALTDTACLGISQTLSQLSRLSMAPCIVLEVDDLYTNDSRKQLTEQAQRLSALLDKTNERGSRVLECVFSVSDNEKPMVSLPRLLDAPLGRGQIPIVLPVAYSNMVPSLVTISPDDAVLALVAELSGNALAAQSEHDTKCVSKNDTQPLRNLVDRIIIIDNDGGIPNPASPDGKHVFLNLEQEFAGIKDALQDPSSHVTERHVANLVLLKKALRMLPQSASGLMTTPGEASNLGQAEYPEAGPTVGTRRQKNALIHNLLTDRPAYSASLPKTRLARPSGDHLLPAVSTFVKRGMPLKIIPDPLAEPWTSRSSRVKLTDTSIDLARLVYLIDDSFNRNLDIERYLERVNDRIAGVIIAGDYEGGAILTWESPPGADPNDLSRQVPYLDKFAVLKRSQGAGGVADIVFNAMVRTCFPHGVCWRSRKDNPVNKWYFERSAGTWKIPDMNWTMFWTTSGITQDHRTFEDYQNVCRGIQPTWRDHAKTAD